MVLAQVLSLSYGAVGVDEDEHAFIFPFASGSAPTWHVNLVPLALGFAVGEADGASVGELVGLPVGFAVVHAQSKPNDLHWNSGVPPYTQASQTGEQVGLAVGLEVGAVVGLVGVVVGLAVGLTVGLGVGLAVGFAVVHVHFRPYDLH